MKKLSILILLIVLLLCLTACSGTEATQEIAEGQIYIWDLI